MFQSAVGPKRKDPSPTRQMTCWRGRASFTPAATPTPSELAVHIDDRASKLFVIAVLVVFVGIILNALFFGVGGLFTPLPTPSPEASPSASPEASPSGWRIVFPA